MLKLFIFLTVVYATYDLLKHGTEGLTGLTLIAIFSICKGFSKIVK